MIIGHLPAVGPPAWRGADPSIPSRRNGTRGNSIRFVGEPRPLKLCSTSLTCPPTGSGVPPGCPRRPLPRFPSLAVVFPRSRGAYMEEVARVILALDEHDVAEEVMHFLDRTGRARVVATASDEHQLSEAVRQLEPDAVVASPVLANSAQLNGTALLAVDTSETVQTLRRALKAGAKGFFLWPADRGELARATARVLAPGVRERETLGRVVAVHGPRGGDIPRHPPRGGLR